MKNLIFFLQNRNFLPNSGFLKKNKKLFAAVNQLLDHSAVRTHQFHLLLHEVDLAIAAHVNNAASEQSLIG